MTKEEQRALWAQQDADDCANAIRGLLDNRGGRVYIWTLLELGKAIGVNPFTGDALTTSFACGEMNIGQQILAQVIEADPAGYINLLKTMETERATRAATERGLPSAADNLSDSLGELPGDTYR